MSLLFGIQEENGVQKHLQAGIGRIGRSLEWSAWKEAVEKSGGSGFPDSPRELWHEPEDDDDPGIYALRQMQRLVFVWAQGKVDLSGLFMRASNSPCATCRFRSGFGSYSCRKLGIATCEVYMDAKPCGSYEKGDPPSVE